MLIRYLTRQAMYHTCNVTVWRVRVTTVAVETQQCNLCALLMLHVTVKYIKIWSEAQQCFRTIVVASNNKTCVGVHVQ
jgi:hypothetical protein